MWYGMFLLDMRRYDEAAAELKQALDLDPLSLIVNSNFADLFYFTRRYDEAIEQYRKTLELNSKFPVYRAVGRVYLQKGLFGKAIEEFQKVEDPLLVYAYNASGKRNEALRLLEEWEKKSSQQRVPPLQRSLVYLGVGKTDLAFEAIDKAYQDRDPTLLNFVKDPLWDHLRSDSRFKALLEKMNLK